MRYVSKWEWPIKNKGEGIAVQEKEEDKDEDVECISMDREKSGNRNCGYAKTRKGARCPSPWLRMWILMINWASCASIILNETRVGERFCYQDKTVDPRAVNSAGNLRNTIAENKIHVGLVR